MSMLAERKRKTKWMINPTKKPLWKSDLGGIKFGKELMEKMGWTPGKGLGLNEQGMRDPLKVSYKNDTKGMGFKENGEDWIEHQNEFNSLLSQLTNSSDDVIVKSSTEEKNKIKSLEEESKKSKARIHYKKFTRGKDLAQYSENDLACILGTNKIKKDKNVEENPSKNENEKQTKEGYEKSFGVTTINSGSIQDYFKKKWSSDKHKHDNCDGVGYMNDNTFLSEEPLDVDARHEGEGEKKKRKGKKRKQESPEDSIEENDPQVIESEILNGADFESEKPKKKKKKHLVKDEIQTKQTTEEIDEMSGVIKGESSYSDKNISETHFVDSDLVSRKHKKKKKKDKVSKNEEETEGDLRMDIDELAIDTNSQVNCSEKNFGETGTLNTEIEKGEISKLVSENHEETTKRKKSKKKSKEISEETIEEPQNEVHVEKKKKKKKDKKRQDEICTIEEEFKDNGKSEEISLESESTNKTKPIEPACLEDNATAQDIKKKKKKKKHEKENQSELEATEDPLIPETTEELKVKKKKSKKEKDVEKAEDQEVKERSKPEPSKEVEPVPNTNENSESKPGGGEAEKNLIHSHKAALFKKKKNQIIVPSQYSNERVLDLVCGAEIQKFKGSNLSDVLGYGVRREAGKRKEMR